MKLGEIEFSVVDSKELEDLRAIRDVTWDFVIAVEKHNHVAARSHYLKLTDLLGKPVKEQGDEPEQSQEPECEFCDGGACQVEIEAVVVDCPIGTGLPGGASPNPYTQFVGRVPRNPQPENGLAGAGETQAAVTGKKLSEQEARQVIQNAFERMRRGTTSVLQPGLEQESVNHPSHYNQGNMEAIEAIEGLGLDFLEGNILKYVARWRHKGGIQDLRKAGGYLERLIETELAAQGQEVTQ